jgi:hypothetical protein
MKIFMTKSSTFYKPQNRLMKTNMRNLIIAIASLGLLAFSSCNKQTCPTYSKAEVNQVQVKA